VTTVGRYIYVYLYIKYVYVVNVMVDMIIISILNWTDQLTLLVKLET